MFAVELRATVECADANGSPTPGDPFTSIGLCVQLGQTAVEALSAFDHQAYRLIHSDSEKGWHFWTDVGLGQYNEPFAAVRAGYGEQP